MRFQTTEARIDGGEPFSCHVVDINTRRDLLRIPVMSMRDPDWSTIDHAGHRHAPEVETDEFGQRMVRRYPSLREVYSPKQFCEDCNEEHRLFDRYICTLCEQTVVPAWTGAREIVVGGESATTIRLEAFTVPANLNLLNGPSRDLRLTIGGETYLVLLGEVSLDSHRGYTLTFHVHPEEN